MSSLRRALRKLPSWSVLAAFAPLALSCAFVAQDRPPQAFVAGSQASATAFAEIRATWGQAKGGEAHRAALRAFVARYPADNLTKLAKALLAIACLEPENSGQGGETSNDTASIACADGALRDIPDPPPGTLGDLVTTARARRLRALGRAEEAMTILRPLSGRTVDPLTRMLFQEELSLTAVATDRPYEAISYMDVWLRSASEEDRANISLRTRAIVATLREDVLTSVLVAIRGDHEQLGYGAEIKEVLHDRLAVIAVQSKNASLARWLRESNTEGSAPEPGEGANLLNELATSTRGIHLVRGRTLGLLLPTSFTALRDESADVLRGVMWALGLPQGVRERALAGISLVTRDDGGDPDRVDFALDELAGEGASIIIAGLDGQGAERAALWAEREKVPVILLTPPRAAAPVDFTFVIGERRARVVQALEAAVPQLASKDTVRVLDESQLLAEREGAEGERSQAVVSCDLPIARASAPRFPVHEWGVTQTAAWLVEGGPSCASDLLSEVNSLAKARVVGLTVESAAALPHRTGISVMAAAVGALPVIVRAETSELGAYLRTYAPPVAWWSALGRDGATLAAMALGTLPDDSASELHAIAERHTAAKAALEKAEAPLWTTEAMGYGGAHELPRAIRVIAIPPKGMR